MNNKTCSIIFSNYLIISPGKDRGIKSETRSGARVSTSILVQLKLLLQVWKQLASKYFKMVTMLFELTLPTGFYYELLFFYLGKKRVIEGYVIGFSCEEILVFKKNF